MIKLITPRHTPPIHVSSEWIAHNAAMKAKQPLLGHGPKPRIGAFARWNTPVMPAIEVHSVRRVNLGQMVRDTLMVIGFVAVIAVIANAGYFVGF